MSRIPLSALPAVALALLAIPSPGLSQTDCELWDSRQLVSRELGSGRYIHYVSRPLFGCRDGTRIRADSAEVYEGQGSAQFFGNVRFEDEGNDLQAGRAHFFNQAGRLVAWDSVVFTDRQSGSVLSGDNLVYVRAGETSSEALITMQGGRPHATLYPRPPAPAEEGDSLTVTDSLEVASEAGDSAVVGPAGASRDSLTVAPDSAALADTLASDSLLAGPDSVAGEVVGDSAQASAEGEVMPEDSVRVPYEVDAYRIFIRGESVFRATGDVEILRGAVLAFADTAAWDQGSGELVLTGSARLEGESYLLTGKRIVLDAAGDELSRVVSYEDAELDGEGVVLNALEIRLFLSDGLMERLVAVAPAPDEDGEEEASPFRRQRLRAADEEETEEEGEEPPTRPRATAQDFVLVADSIEVQAPGEVLERLVAVGGARGESTARDSLNTEDTPAIASRDWLEGDTIVASFTRDERTPGPEEGSDSRREARRAYQVDTLWAFGSARSLYRSEPSGAGESPDSTAPADSVPAAVMTPPDSLVEPVAPTPDSVAQSVAISSDSVPRAGISRLAINYVTGKIIKIVMREGEVDWMEVTGPTKGLQLEPVRRPQRPGGAAADTSASAVGETLPGDAVAAGVGGGGDENEGAQGEGMRVAIRKEDPGAGLGSKGVGAPWERRRSR